LNAAARLLGGTTRRSLIVDCPIGYSCRPSLARCSGASKVQTRDVGDDGV